MSAEQPSWGTPSEVEWIRNIGRHFCDGNMRELCSSKKQIVLLKNYIESIPKRVNWGQIDKDRVEQFAKKELERRTK